MTLHKRLGLIKILYKILFKNIIRSGASIELEYFGKPMRTEWVNLVEQRQVSFFP
jgi:hypothetical protein